MKEAQRDYNWMLVIIHSCSNDFHFEGVDKLVELFKAKYDDGTPYMDQLFFELVVVRLRRWNLIHSILN